MDVQICLAHNGNFDALLSRVKSRCCCETAIFLIVHFKYAVAQLTDQFMSTVEDKIARTEQSDFEWWRKLATIDERKVLRNRQAGLFG